MAKNATPRERRGLACFERSCAWRETIFSLPPLWKSHPCPAFGRTGRPVLPSAPPAFQWTWRTRAGQSWACAAADRPVQVPLCWAHPGHAGARRRRVRRFMRREAQVRTLKGCKVQEGQLESGHSSKVWGLGAEAQQVSQAASGPLERDPPSEAPPAARSPPAEPWKQSTWTLMGPAWETKA